MHPSPQSVRSGALLAYRLFDVAYAIDLDAAGRIWATQRGAGGERRRLTATPAKAMDFGVPPLVLALDPMTLDLGGWRTLAELSARIYDFGVIVLTLSVAVRDMAWTDFVTRLRVLESVCGAGARAQPWAQALGALRDILAPAMVRPAATAIEEDYLVGMVRAFDVPVEGPRLPEMLDLVPLMSGESRPLSEGARRDVLRHQYSFYADDLTVLTWDRAFLLEPRGDTDVLDVLEVANAQLLEMRYYDELLDAELPRMYDLVEDTRRTASALAARRVSRLARRLYTLVAEVTELTERVDNALQVTEDVYLARIYAAALDLFRVPDVTSAVNRKLAIIRDTYESLYDDAQGRRAELLEILIVALILIEVGLAIWRL